MSSDLSHLRPACRAFRRRPGLTVARVVTVAIVVAAVSSVTAIASATLFRQLPYPHAERLTQIQLMPVDSTEQADATTLFPVVFNHLDARGPSIEAVAGILPLDRA